jgi:hypothetical protein
MTLQYKLILRRQFLSEIATLFCGLLNSYFRKEPNFGQHIKVQFVNVLSLLSKRSFQVDGTIQFFENSLRNSIFVLGALLYLLRSSTGEYHPLKASDSIDKDIFKGVHGLFY